MVELSAAADGAPTGTTVVMVPGAGALPSYLRPLARELAVLGPVMGVVTGDEQSIRALAIRVAASLLRQRPAAAVVVGHSWGAVVAHAVAAELEAQRVTVDAVVLLDPPPPSPRWPSLRRRAALDARPVVDPAPSESPRAAASAEGDRRHVAHVGLMADHRTPRVAAPCLVVRAGSGVAAPTAEHPWSRHVGRLVGIDSPGTHTGMVLEPHVGELGRRILRALDGLRIASR